MYQEENPDFMSVSLPVFTERSFLKEGQKRERERERENVSFLVRICE